MAAVFLFLVPKTDELPATAVTGQAVWLTAAVTVPPAVAALVAAEDFLFTGRNLLQRSDTVPAYTRSAIFYRECMDLVAVADGFYCIWGE